MAGLPHVIRSLLIANRGEIAVRILRTCRDRSIKAVAVYSDADRNALHVRLADEAIGIGRSEAAASYLAIDRVIAAARAAGVDAVHPGYGFLSENAEFARRVEDAGIIFVGPSSATIAEMGSKSRAKRVAERARVPVVPGYAGDEQSLPALEALAIEIGFPLLVKASAGGGGRGMRVVASREMLARSLAEARQEAVGAFGDGSLLLERFVPRARHVEVQIAGDRLGSVIHLLERDCSIQRRHQKVVEECPAPALDPELRASLRRSAVTIASAVGYRNLGTVEFLVDAESEEYWFLEMNPRLQVEHPVTEAVTGLDLVALQLRIAAGEPLGMTQEDVRTNGWAIEGRVAAEDPSRGYQPETGVIGLYQAPRGEGVRVDSGVDTGSEIAPYYDSLVAKVIAWGSDREEARSRLIQALGQWTSLGVRTNAAWLAAIAASGEFAAGTLTTSFLASTGLDRWKESVPESPIIAAGAALVARRAEDPAAGPWASLGGWRIKGTDRIGGGRLVVGSRESGVGCSGSDAGVWIDGSGGRYQVRVGERVHLVVIENESGGPVRVTVDGRSTSLTAFVDGDVVWLHDGSRDLAIHLHSPRPEATNGRGAGRAEAHLTAPLPGVVTSVSAAVGRSVSRGDVVLVMEAMKLVHALTARADGVVRAVHCRPGMTVSSGQVLIELDPATNQRQ